LECFVLKLQSFELGLELELLRVDPLGEGHGAADGENDRRDPRHGDDRHDQAFQHESSFSATIVRV
jgi:hypothetical protein